MKAQESGRRESFRLRVVQLCVIVGWKAKPVHRWVMGQWQSNSLGFSFPGRQHLMYAWWLSWGALALRCVNLFSVVFVSTPSFSRFSRLVICSRYCLPWVAHLAKDSFQSVPVCFSNRSKLKNACDCWDKVFVVSAGGWRCLLTGLFLIYRPIK